MTPKIIGIIPARGGSKGIPRKNIRCLNGHPLIYYSIRSAQLSRRLTRWVVSTEDEEIRTVAERLGAEVLQRPKHLAEDETPMLPVIQHAIRSVADDFDYVIILQPTCPLRTGEDIDRAVQVLVESNADSIVSVYRVEDTHPGRMYLLEAGRLKTYAPSLISLNRQDLPPVYHRNGAIYGVKTEIVINGSIYGTAVAPYIMARERSLNIDDIFDWRLAECILKEIAPQRHEDTKKK